jgi:hypothetical protein
MVGRRSQIEHEALKGSVVCTRMSESFSSTARPRMPINGFSATTPVAYQVSSLNALGNEPLIESLN